MKLIDILKKQLAELNSMRPENRYFPGQAVMRVFFAGPDRKSRLEQKFYRWRHDTSKIIEKYISPEEKKIFKKFCPQKKSLYSFHLKAPFFSLTKRTENSNALGIEQEMEDCAAYLKALIENIQEKPELFEGIHETAIINSMHREVAKIAKDRIKNKEYKGIIFDVCISLNKYIQKKADIAGLDGAALMEKAFSPDNPKIILSDEKVGDKKFKEEQKGFMFLFSGAMKTIRNKAGHHHKLYKVESLQDTLEILGFFSFLFKMTDSRKDKKK